MAFSFASYRVKVKGDTPLLMHNGDIGCNPLHPIVKLKKSLTGKRKKTDDDLASIAILEWYLGLYLDDLHEVETITTKDEIDKITFTGGKVTILPGKVFKASICNAGTNFKLKSTLRPNLRISFNCKFDFEGGDIDPNTLVNNRRFSDIRPVVVNRSRVMACRPVFPNWKAEFDMSFFTDKLDLKQVTDCIELAGQGIGICDYRPQNNGTFGTFKIVEIKEI